MKCMFEYDKSNQEHPVIQEVGDKKTFNPRALLKLIQKSQQANVSLYALGGYLQEIGKTCMDSGLTSLDDEIANAVKNGLSKLQLDPDPSTWE